MALKKRLNAKCVICGCTDSKACPGGCYWVLVDYSRKIGICSKCIHDPIIWIKKKLAESS